MVWKWVPRQSVSKYINKLPKLLEVRVPLVARYKILFVILIKKVIHERL